jgi:hypothetical protein
MLEEEEDLLDFNLFTGEILRKMKGQKDYFFPVQAFLLQWLNAYSRDPEKIINPNLLEEKNYIQSILFENLSEDDADNKAADAALAELLKSLPAGVAHLGEGALNQKTTKPKNAKPSTEKNKEVKHKDNVIDFSAYQKKR